MCVGGEETQDLDTLHCVVPKPSASCLQHSLTRSECITTPPRLAIVATVSLRGSRRRISLAKHPEPELHAEEDSAQHVAGVYAFPPRDGLGPGEKGATRVAFKSAQLGHEW